MGQLISYISSQVWKIWVMYVGGVIGLTMIFLPIFVNDILSNYYSALVIILGVLIVLFSFAFPCIFMRCPNCGVKLFWMAISKQRSGQGMRWLFSQTSCPCCHNKLYR